MKRFVLIMAVLPMLAACNTMEGVGEDVKHGGKKLEDSASKNNNYGK
jgi:predicted small secreted protein